MRTIGTSTAALLIASSAVMLAAQPGTATPGAPRPDPAPLSASVAAQPVTLPTGDRVLVSGSTAKPVVRLVPNSASSAEPDTVLTLQGHTYVVPGAAAGLIGRGLDLSLFDVSALASRPGGPITLTADQPTSSRTLPPGLVAAGGESVRVRDPHAFGAALAAADASLRRSGRQSDVLHGLDLRLAGSPAAASGRLTAPPPRGHLYTVTVVGLDRTGAKDTGDIGVLVNTDDSARFIAGQSFYRGRFSFSVPRGHYSVQSFIATGSGHASPSYTLVSNPQFFVGHDRTVTLDARTGTRFTTTTPRASRVVHGELNLQRMPVSGLSFTDSLVTFDPTALFAAPTRRVTVGKMYFYPAVRKGDGHGSLDRYLYDLEFPSIGHIPDSLRYDVTDGDLATVDAGYSSVVPGRSEEESDIGGLPWQTTFVGSINDLTAPLSRTEYVTARHRLRWHQEVDLDAADGYGRTIAPAAVYRPGQQVSRVWHAQPMGSGVEQEHHAGQACPVCRSGDTLSVTVFPHVDTAGDFMLADGATSEQLTLYQDGTEVGQSRSGFGSFPMSPDPASYRLEYDVDTAASWWPTSTHVATSWTFDSQERAPSHLPPGWTCGGKSARATEATCSFEDLLLTRFHTTAGLDGVIPAGTVAHVLVHVAPQRGMDPDPLATLTAQVSYDGGGTWQAVQADRRSDTTYRLSYRQPDLAATDGYASLRVTAVADSGSGVDQTVVHAYPLAASDAAQASSDGGPAQPSCTAPVAPPLTRCMTAIAAAGRAAAPNDPPSGYGPTDLQQAYHLPSDPTSQATVAVVAPYDYPSAAADLAAYRSEFGLPACPVGDCLQIVNQQGQGSPLPPPSPDWAVQTAQSLDAVSATCPTCRILLVEADSTSLDDLVPAALTAGRLHADVIDNGYGTIGEFASERRYESSYRSLAVPFVAASGDYGYGNGAPLIGSISYPSASRSAVAVGGTTLTPDGGRRGFTESAWSSTTSGCSAYIAKPAWQHDPLCDMRTTADTAADADPATGIAVYDTYGYGGWLVVGGTSLAAALVSGVYGLADDTAARPARRLYRDGASLFDVTSGSNGTCRRTYLCVAKRGYDGPSGAGTPNGLGAF